MLEAVDDSFQPTSEASFEAELLDHLDETPSPEVPEAQPEPAQPEPAADAATVTEPVAETQATPEPEAAATEQPADAPETPAPVDVTDAPPTTTEPTPEPFHFRVDGKRVAPDGMTRSGDTITLSAETWDRQVMPYLANRGAIAQREAQLRRQLEQKGTREAQSEALIKQMESVTAMDDEALVNWAFELRQKMPVVLKDAEIAALKSQHQPLVEQQQAEQQALSDQQVEEWLGGTVDYFLDQRPEYQALKADPDARKSAERALALALPTILSKGTGEDGQPAFQANWERFHQVLGWEAERAAKWAERDAAFKKIEAAAKANAAKVKAAPPAVSGQGKPAGAVAKQPPKDRDEFEARLRAFAEGNDF